MTMILKNIPNAITLLRLVLIIPFVWYLLCDQYQIAFYIFIIAGLSDGIDGWLARYFHWQSFFGSFVDPMADKLLIASSFISLALLGSLPWWLVVLVFLRDLTISIGIIVWYYFIPRKLDFEPTLLSKYNTTLQLVLVTLCLFELAYYKFPPYLVNGLITITAITTFITYIHYLWIGCNKAWAKKN